MTPPGLAVMKGTNGIKSATNKPSQRLPDNRLVNNATSSAPATKNGFDSFVSLANREFQRPDTQLLPNIATQSPTQTFRQTTREAKQRPLQITTRGTRTRSHLIAANLASPAARCHCRRRKA